MNSSFAANPTDGGRVFQVLGPNLLKALSPYVFSFVLGTDKKFDFCDLNCLGGQYGVIISLR